VSKDWASRAALPAHVAGLIASFPAEMHPMSQLVSAVAALQTESKFAKAYADKSMDKVQPLRLTAPPPFPRAARAHTDLHTRLLSTRRATCGNLPTRIPST
jgi:citrate synthase